MSTFVERYFKIQGVMDCYYTKTDGSTGSNLVAGIEIQIWQHGVVEDTLLGRGLTNDLGEYTIDIEVDSPTARIVDGKIEDIFIKAYYNGQLLTQPEFDSDAQNYFNVLTPAPSFEYKVAVNKLVLQLKEDENWSKLDRLWIFATEFQEHAVLNLKEPYSTPVDEINSPAWTANEGYTGDGSSNYLVLNFDVGTATNYKQDDSSFGCYSRLSIDGTKVNMGFNISSCQSYIIPNDSGSMYAAINSNSNLNNGVATSAGLSHMARDGANSEILYKDGVSIRTGSDASVTVPNANVFALAKNDGGTPSDFSDDQISMIFIGSSAIDQEKLYDALQAFATARKFNV